MMTGPLLAVLLSVAAAAASSSAPSSGMLSLAVLSCFTPTPTIEISGYNDVTAALDIYLHCLGGSRVAIVAVTQCNLTIRHIKEAPFPGDT